MRDGAPGGTEGADAPGRDDHTSRRVHNSVKSATVSPSPRKEVASTGVAVREKTRIKKPLYKRRRPHIGRWH
jgi:hypothetical protein